jgi:hypothetical protein
MQNYESSEWLIQRQTTPSQLRIPDYPLTSYFA